MSGLLTAVVGIEAVEKRPQVVPVHRKAEALDDLGRLCSSLCAHGPICSLLSVCWERYAGRFLPLRLLDFGGSPMCAPPAVRPHQAPAKLRLSMTSCLCPSRGRPV